MNLYLLFLYFSLFSPIVAHTSEAETLLTLPIASPRQWIFVLHSDKSQAKAFKISLSRFILGDGKFEKQAKLLKEQNQRPQNPSIKCESFRIRDILR